MTGEPSIGDTVSIAKTREHPNDGVLFIARACTYKKNGFWNEAESYDLAVSEKAMRDARGIPSRVGVPGVTHARFNRSELIQCKTMLTERL